ncbi:hypothetical protein [Xanthomonas fragariae]|uniref:hypothetical protein n=1 Tax=Xanthomonas fragariae TaxID=48664 RepID=UPI003530E188
MSLHRLTVQRGRATLGRASLNSSFTKDQATDVILRQSAVITALNVGMETLDWLNVTRHEADEAGTQQF